MGICGELEEKTKIIIKEIKNGAKKINRMDLALGYRNKQGVTVNGCAMCLYV